MNLAPTRSARPSVSTEYDTPCCFAALRSSAPTPAAYGLVADVQQLIPYPGGSCVVGLFLGKATTSVLSKASAEIRFIGARKSGLSAPSIAGPEADTGCTIMPRSLPPPYSAEKVGPPMDPPTEKTSPSDETLLKYREK